MDYGPGPALEPVVGGGEAVPVRRQPHPWLGLDQGQLGGVLGPRQLQEGLPGGQDRGGPEGEVHLRPSSVRCLNSHAEQMFFRLNVKILHRLL